MTKAAGSRTAALLLAAALLTIAVSPAASSVLQPPRVSLSTIQQPLKAAAAAALSQQLSGAPAVLPLQVQPITALTPGDIIATGYMVSPSADTIVKTMYVLDRATFAVKGSFQPDMCPFIVGVPAMSPDGSTLTLACWWSESGSLISVSADGSSPPVNLTTLAADVTPQPGLQYVMGASTGANYSLLLPSATSDPQLITAEAQKTVIKFNGTSFDVEASYGMGATFFLPFSGAAVTADGSQCLSVNLSSSVQALDLTTGQLGPDLFTLPEGLQQDSTCSDVLTLYDGNVIVACSGQTINAGKPAVCAFLLAGSSAAADSNSTSQAGTILRTWCTSKPLPPGPVPSDQATLLPGARQTSVVPIATISLAMDVDRQSFYMAVYVYWNVVVGEYVNLFKIKLSDFAEIAGAALPLATDGIMVYGALPANQQECGIDSMCCTPAGKIAAKRNVCRTSHDPCSGDSFCDGVTATCPEPEQVAEEGTLCSLYPFGLFSPVHHHHHNRAEFDVTEGEALEKNYHKCYSCQSGACTPKKHHYGYGHYDDGGYAYDHHHARGGYDRQGEDSNNNYNRRYGGSRSLLDGTPTDAQVQNNAHMDRDWAWCK